MSCLPYCFNFCTFLSCIGDMKNAVSKLCPCCKGKPPAEPEYKEEMFKITFLGNTILKFERVSETEK